MYIYSWKKKADGKIRLKLQSFSAELNIGNAELQVLYFVSSRKRSTYELLVHHTLVIICFSIAVVYHEYVAYAALSLMVEINSVFLHARQLFIIVGEPKSSLRFAIYFDKNSKEVPRQN